MMMYIYQGARPLTMTRQYGAVITLKPCGTEAAYKRHLANSEVACGPCLSAHRIVVRRWDRENNTRPPRQVAPCGTASAYKRHLRNKEPVDTRCRTAASAYAKQLRHNKAEGSLP